MFHAAEITNQSSGVTRHNAIGVGECYHAFLWKLFEEIMKEDNHASPITALNIAKEIVNDTAEIPGVVPTLLVFGVLQRIPIRPVELSI